MPSRWPSLWDLSLALVCLACPRSRLKMMTEGTGGKDVGIGITTGITTETMTVTETAGGGEAVTASITTTGGGDAIAITGIIGTVGIAGNNQRTRRR
jgi:hypothetical protein